MRLKLNMLVKDKLMISRNKIPQTNKTKMKMPCNINSSKKTKKMMLSKNNNQVEKSKKTEMKNQLNNISN